MRKILVTLLIFCPLLVLAEEPQCAELSNEAFLESLVQLSEEHMQMQIEDVHIDYQKGVSFILNTFGEDSVQYKGALTFIEETATMNLEEMGLVEDLRIQIIPILGPENIYKGHHKTLMRKCREILLAAMVLT